ncbi:hypothetical protein [Streptomyces sp. CA-106131]|uniref:hypothetical protein n=1 Tax=Streptomyces sp. CA-106131 TaxID=3240045 RepID=UPI003D907868
MTTAPTAPDTDTPPTATSLAEAIGRHYDQRAAQAPHQDDELRAAVAHNLAIQRPTQAAQPKEPQQ